MNANEYLSSLLSSIDARIAYERAKNAENENIVSTLTDIRKSCDHVAIAEVMLSASVDANTINKSERSNARFNVYAFEKIVNVARAASAASALNHYSRAILATAKKFAESELLMTHDDAQSACTLDIRVKDAKREKQIVKYQKHVSAKTAATQSSSSLNALKAFNVLTEKRDAANKVCFTINAESELTKKLLSSIN